MKQRLIIVCILIVYIAILIKVMVFKDLPTIRIGQLMLNFSGTDAGHAPNFVPFKTIVPYLFGYKGWIIAGVNLVGNIALLVPIGFLLPSLYKNITWRTSLIVAGASGLLIELLQTVLRVGIFDIDDVILNTLGVMIGYFAFIILTKWIRERRYIHIFFTMLLVFVTAAGALYAIYPHGEPVMNPRGDIGTQYESVGNEQESEVPESEDLCGGTGGTGQIVSRGTDTITLKRNDGVKEILKLTAHTEIKTSAGPATEADLKIGDRVTVVVYDSETATAVLVCSL